MPKRAIINKITIITNINFLTFIIVVITYNKKEEKVLKSCLLRKIMAKHRHIESEYELELDKILREIKKQRAKLICLQFPRGLANKATEIADFIETNTKAKCLIWIGPTFGACDLPPLDLYPKVDLLIHFGHTEWKFKKRK